MNQTLLFNGLQMPHGLHSTFARRCIARRCSLDGKGWLDGKHLGDSGDSRFPVNLNKDSKRQEEQEESSETDTGVRSS